MSCPHAERIGKTPGLLSFSSQDPFAPQLFVLADLVHIFRRVDNDKIKSLAQPRRVGKQFRVRADAVRVVNYFLPAVFAKKEIEDERGGVRQEAHR